MRSKSISLVFNVLLIILSIILLTNYVRFMYGAGSMTFEALFEYLSSSFNLPFNTIVDLSITADWGVFNFFRDFINIFANLMTIIYFIASNLVSSLILLVRLISFLFAF